MRAAKPRVGHEGLVLGRLPEQPLGFQRPKRVENLEPQTERQRPDSGGDQPPARLGAKESRRAAVDRPAKHIVPGGVAQVEENAIGLGDRFEHPAV